MATLAEFIATISPWDRRRRAPQEGGCDSVHGRGFVSAPEQESTWLSMGMGPRCPVPTAGGYPGLSSRVGWAVAAAAGHQEGGGRALLSTLVGGQRLVRSGALRASM